jgi:hypothetical protein
VQCQAVFAIGFGGSSAEAETWSRNRRGGAEVLARAKTETFSPASSKRRLPASIRAAKSKLLSVSIVCFGLPQPRSTIVMAADTTADGGAFGSSSTRTKAFSALSV